MPIHQEKPISPIPGHKDVRRSYSVEHDMSTPCQGFSLDGTETYSDANSSGAAHRRKIPTPLVLSASSSPQRNFQLTSPEQTIFSHPAMVDGINQRRLPLRQRSFVHQSNSTHHVKMGIRHSCPHTPLKSSRSSPGLTPTISRWQDSETECDLSIQSLTSTERTQNTEELHPALFLPNHKPLSLDLSVDHIWRSPTSTVRTSACSESFTSDSGSIYSNDSDRSEESPLSLISGALLSGASVSITTRLSGNELSSGRDLNFVPEPCTPTYANIQVDNSPKSPHEGAELTNTQTPSDIKATRIEQFKSKPRAYSTVTPSPIQEPTKTIQLRRSFGQLLLFRRPSQIQANSNGQVLPSSNGKDTASEDEEKEELQTGAQNDQTPTGIESPGECQCHCKCKSGSAIALNNRFKQDATEECNRSRAPSNDLQFRSKSSDEPMQHCPHELRRVNGQTTSHRNSVSDGPKGLLKLVKSQSSLREKFSMQQSPQELRRVNDQTTSHRNSVSDGPKGLLKLVQSHTSLREKFFRSRSQSGFGLQQDEIMPNSPESPDLWGSKQNFVAQDYDPFLPKAANSKVSQGLGRELSGTPQYRSVEKVVTMKSNPSQSSSGDAQIAPKSAVSNQSSSLKILKFWKRKKVQHQTDLKTKNDAMKNQAAQKIKKPSFKKNEAKSDAPRIDCQSTTKNARPSFQTSTSFLNLNVMEELELKRGNVMEELETSRAAEISNSSLGRAYHSKYLMGSPNSKEGYKSPTLDKRMQSEVIEKLRSNFPKPTRPPRKIPVTTKTM